MDCCSDTLNVDVEQIERAITPKTKAIIPVHFGGQPCDLDSILAIARANNLYVIEDAAHALPARYREKTVGSIGDITCFSFYVTKTITTGEGGMITTNDPTWAERMRSMSLHGLSHDAWKRNSSHGSWFYEIVSPGFKYNMTDIAASLGIAQLRKCDRFLEVRRGYAAMYDEGFREVSQVSAPCVKDGAQHAWHLYVIQLNLEQLRIGRNEMIEWLRKENIGTSVHFIPLHLHPYYRDRFGYGPKDFPVASAVFDQILSLPIYPKMTKTDVLEVIHSVTKIVRHYQR